MAKGKQKSIFSTFGFRLLVLTTIVAVGIYGVKGNSQNTNFNPVLGTSTILADKGSDLENNSQNLEQTAPKPPHEQLNVEDLNNVSFETQAHNRVRLGHSSIEMSTDDGHLQIKAKHEDGTETELDDNSLDTINQTLENEDLEISTNSGGFGLRHGQFEAQTHFPLSINPTTNELTVTTPAGTKVVAVLPDQAVNNLINQKFITVVASDSADTGITLDTFDNQPAFQIHGKSLQKLFGLFPISIDKTAFVSAENGSVLSVNQSFLSKLFDLLSN